MRSLNRSPFRSDLKEFILLRCWLQCISQSHVGFHQGTFNHFLSLLARFMDVHYLCPELVSFLKNGLGRNMAEK